jgi:hypothetical protein
VEGVNIIESSLSTRHIDPLKNHLFILAHYQTLLKTIARAPNYFFSSLTNDIHIMGPMNEIISAFDHFSTQLALVGLTVKMAKCKLWSPSWNYPCIKILLGYTLVTNGLCYGPATNKWRITRQDKTSFIDPSTGVGLLKGCSPDYLLL